MSGNNSNECGFCGAFILDGQRWVREKIFDAAHRKDGDVKYRRYHAEVVPGEQLSCWENHLMQLEIAPARAA